MSLSEATGAPAPVTIGDTTYQATPLNLWELGAIEESVRALVLNAAVRAAEGLPGPLAEKLMDRALGKVVGITFDSPEFSAYTRTFAGICDLIATSLRAQHPAVKAATIAPILSSNPQQYEAAATTVMRISGFGRAGKDGEKPGEASGAGEAA